MNKSNYYTDWILKNVAIDYQTQILMSIKFLDYPLK